MEQPTIKGLLEEGCIFVIIALYKQAFLLIVGSRVESKAIKQ